MSSIIIAKRLYKIVLKTATTIVCLLIYTLALSTLAQASNQQYKIEDFSDDYYALIKLIDDEDSETNSIVEIRDAKTKRVLISQPVYIDIDYELENSKEQGLGDQLSANVVSLPYGDSSILIYEDFNFDNKADLAIKDGRNGCYGGPSYQVYLKQGRTFVHSEGFTELAQGYCGFFDVDEDTQTLHTMTKSGAAWHQHSDYKVINNQPVAVRIIEEEYNYKGLISIVEKTLVNGKMVENQYQQLAMYEEGDDSSRYVYGFDLDSGKKMILDSYGEDHLYYAFTDKNGKIELYYDGQFVYDSKRKSLSFTNRPVVYQINSQGIRVRTSNKTLLLKLKSGSVGGRLNDVAKFKNVRVK